MMATRIIINGKEVTNPYVKAVFILGAIVVTALVTALVIFVLLPIIGVAVTLSIGFIVIFIFASVLGVVTLGIVWALFAWLFGTAEFRFEKTHKRY